MIAGARLACGHAALVVIALSATSSAASAQARAVRGVGEITMRECASLREREVRDALEAELRGLDVTGDAPLDIAIECAGQVAVVLSVRGSERPPRALDVSDVPERLRARLVALAIAELLRIEALFGRSEESDIQPEPEPVPVPDSPSAPDSAPVPEPEPVPVPDSPSPTPDSDPLALGAPAGRARAARGALARVPLDATRPRSPLLAPIVRGGLRVFPQRGVVLAGGDALVRVGPVSLGVHASAAPERPDVLGALLPSLVLGLAELSLLCLDHALVELCGGARLAVGRAAIDARPVRAGIDARSLDAPYVEGALALSAALVIDVVAIGVDASVGWAEGLVALADAREVLALAGPVIVLSLSLEVLP